MEFIENQANFSLFLYFSQHWLAALVLAVHKVFLVLILLKLILILPVYYHHLPYFQLIRSVIIRHLINLSIITKLQKMESQNFKEQKHTKYTVCVRIKPNLTNQNNCITPFQQKYIKQHRSKSVVTYCFDRVFEQSQNNQFIYNESLRKTVYFFLNKKINTTILAYGQTGSGKTFTLFGNKNKKEAGIINYMIEDIINFTTSKGVTAKCSFLQIYKEKVSDLMTSTNVQLRQNSNGELLLQGLKIFQIKQKQELISLLQQAHNNKIFGNSYINSQSSRSHVIFTIQIQKRKFNIVDLCGSEVLTYQFGQQQREETNSINLSLFTLNAVISDLAFSQKNKNKFIPFRNSVLTRILKESLLDMQKSQIYLFCNVSPEQKHQGFTASTLRFGQLAIQIDEANNIVQQKVNLSQQKRDKKVVSNIIEMNPEMNKSAGTYKINWTCKTVKILDKKTKTYSLLNEQAQFDILILHAYGYGCCGDDWNLHVHFLSKMIKANIYSVDFPGFGDSEGKKFTSRSQKFSEKEQPIEFMSKLLEILGFSQKKKVILMGYDLGGAIALSCALNTKMAKIIETIAVFHPTWTDSLQKLAPINIPTILIWCPVETFHLISAGQKMAKLIKTSKLFKLNIGPYTNEKAGGYYDSYSQTIQNLVADFIKQNRLSRYSNNENALEGRSRGGIVEQNIQVNISKEEQELRTAQDAVRQIYKIIEEGAIKQVYESLIKSGPNKPKFIRLTAQLPNIEAGSLSWQFCQKYLLFHKIPKKSINFDNLPFLVPNQQLQIYTKINLNALSENNSYLCYNSDGQLGITHKAMVSKDQTEQQIVENQKVKIKIKNINGQISQIDVPLQQVLYLNSPTVYKKNNLGNLIFEDSVNCNYSSNFVKLKLTQCCFLLQHIVSQMDFTVNDQNLLFLQQKCSKIIYQQIDLKHLVHQGIDNTRYTGIDVGRLAYYGQGNCHHLASVTAALLLPFGKILGWDVIFRAGSFFKTGREIDEQGNPLPGWNGKPKVNVQDHTWLQIRYKPSNKIFVFDPSFAICSAPLDEIYSFQGRMHISGKKLNFALDNQIPQKLWNNQ